MMRLILLALALIGAPLFAATKPAPHRPVHRAAPAAPRGPVNWVKTFAATPEGGVRMGNPAAPVKLIEYGSRLCPYCAHFHAESLTTLRAKYVASGKVSYEFRDYPVHGALDIPAILIGHCVSTANYFPLLDDMMASQPKILAHEEAALNAAQQQGIDKAPPPRLATFFAEQLGLIDFMAKRGMPPVQTRACLAAKPGFAALAKRYDDANRLYNVRGTPTFIVNGKVADGVNDWAALEPLLKAAGA
jgi:protein-disulfide isomerase